MPKETSSARKVDFIPDLNQVVYPSLPFIPDDQRIVRISESPLGNKPQEDVLSVFTNIAIQSGRVWRPLSSKEFSAGIEYFLNSPMRAASIGEKFFKALQELADNELIELISCEGKEYIVPSIELAAMLQASKIEFIFEG